MRLPKLTQALSNPSLNKEEYLSELSLALQQVRIDCELVKKECRIQRQLIAAQRRLLKELDEIPSMRLMTLEDAVLRNDTSTDDCAAE